MRRERGKKKQNRKLGVIKRKAGAPGEKRKKDGSSRIWRLGREKLKWEHMHPSWGDDNGSLEASYSRKTSEASHPFFPGLGAAAATKSVVKERRGNLRGSSQDEDGIGHWLCGRGPTAPGRPV